MSRVIRYVMAVPGTNTVAYASGDAFGTNMTVPMPGNGAIRNIILTDLPQANVNVDVIFATGTITATNNDALDPSDAQLNTILGVVLLDTGSAFADNSVRQAAATFEGLAYQADTADVRIQLVARGAITLGAGDAPQLTVYVEV